MSKTTILYKDIAPGAADDATVTATGGSGTLSEIPFGIEPGKLLTLERSRWVLDGTYDDFYATEKVGFWSTELSDASGSFSTAPVITLSFTQQYSSMGVQLTFDEDTGEYCNEVEISWYQGNVLRRAKGFHPDSVVYFCECKVESFDKVEIKLKNTVVPYRRARVNEVVLGVVRKFGMNEIRSASMVNQSNESAVELPVSTLSWTLDSLKDVEYMFQLKQPVEVWNDNRHLGTYYINSTTRTTANVYVVECQDALGVLDYTPYPGGAFLDGVSAMELLTELAKPFEVEYDSSIGDTTLKGVIMKGTNRSAIQQVIFAWGVCLATDGGSKIRVFKQPTRPVLIPRGRTFVGSQVTTGAVVTKVSVTAHEYAEATNGTVVINGAKYSDKATVYEAINPNVTASDRENVKEITAATLVSDDIGQEVADRLYRYYSLRDTNSARVVYGGEKLGDCVSVYTPWGLLTTGNLHKMEITLSNTVVYQAEVTGAWIISPYYYYCGDLYSGEV